MAGHQTPYNPQDHFTPETRLWIFTGAAISIFVSMIVTGGVLAKYVRHRISNNTLQCFNAAAAGLFMAMAFYHIFPEALAKIVENQTKEKDDNKHRIFMTHDKAEDFNEALEPKLQWAGILVFAGYSLILFSERVLANLFLTAPEKKTEETQPLVNKPCSNIKNTIIGEPSPRLHAIDMDLSGRKTSNIDNCPKQHCHHTEGHDVAVCKGHSHGVPQNTGFVSSCFLLLALSIHGMSEGYITGNIMSGSNDFTQGFACVIGICGHKWIEGFVIMLSLLKEEDTVESEDTNTQQGDIEQGNAKPKKEKVPLMRCVIFLGLCAMSSPIGMLINVILSFPQFDQASPYINAIAVGTLVYVAVTEIVPESFVDIGNFSRSLYKFLLFCMSGAALMVFLHFCDVDDPQKTGWPTVYGKDH